MKQVGIMRNSGLDHQTVLSLLLFLRMSADERTLEVLAPPPGVHEDLLSLYFENKRRSGGGPLASSERRGDCVVLVFEEASGAGRRIGSFVMFFPCVQISCSDEFIMFTPG